ncbi:MAG TPA: hypothetical protein VKH44_01010 [Pirellulaceae bacterium]|nr:hypothetical protein [Pirellulaceae bacterium]
MRTARQLRRAESDCPVGAAGAPHIFVPGPHESSFNLGELFDLKGRPGYYNPAAKSALLRREKKPPHDELLVDFSRPDVHIELKAADIPLVVGDWTWEATIAGDVLNQQGAWSEVCWHREDACDYLEIELPLSHGWKIERQMLLAREDRFLLLADALLGPNHEAVEARYSHSLEIAGQVSIHLQHETREVHLEAKGRKRACVVPPALAEWRCEFCHAELTAASGRLTLQQAAMGRNLFAPLWIDFDPRRSQRPVTWRRLTVGENLAIVERDRAVAYRIQAGREQWLIYRSLAPPGNRSVLGYNTVNSLDCLRILPAGKTQEILAIE